MAFSVFMEFIFLRFEIVEDEDELDDEENLEYFEYIFFCFYFLTLKSF